MKDCREIKIQLPDFIQDRIPAEEKERVADHLLHCASCREASEEIRRLLNLLNEPAVEFPTQAYWQTFLARVHQRLGDRKGRSLFGLRQAELEPWLSKVLIPLAGLVAAFVVITQITIVPENLQSSSELRVIVQQMDTTEIRKVTEGWVSPLVPEPNGSWSTISREDETGRALVSELGLTDLEVEQLERTTLSGYLEAGVDSLTDEELEAVISHFRGERVL
jgi:hypothetical protein